MANYHEWGSDFDWKGLDQAINIIAKTTKRYGRFGGSIKEKYGTIRFSPLNLGIISLHSLIYPCYYYNQFPQWLWKLDVYYIGPFLQKTLGRSWFWYQRKVYNYAYQKAVKKFPHLIEEIIVDADYPEYIIPHGMEVHNKYWTTMK